MQPELRQLLDRLADESIKPGSTQTVAWHACREVEALQDRTMVDELVVQLDQEMDKDRRDNIYFTIGKIGINLKDPLCARILLASLDREKDKWVITHILERIGEIPKPREFDLSRVFPFLEDPKWYVRHGAIHSLANSESEAAEDRLIEHLRNTKDQYEMIHCQAALCTTGTLRAIAAITPNLKSRKMHVRSSAKFVVDAIKSRFGKSV